MFDFVFLFVEFVFTEEVVYGFIVLFIFVIWGSEGWGGGTLTFKSNL